MFCSQCGIENAHGNRFCPSCGKELSVGIQESELSSGHPISIPNTPTDVLVDKNDSQIGSMEFIYQGVTRFLFFSKTGSVVNTLIDLMVSIKNVGFGIAWKAVSKVFPPILIIDKYIDKIQSSLQNVTLPISALHETLPDIITHMKQTENCETKQIGFSGQLLSVTSLLPDIQNQLGQLNSGVIAVHKAMNGFDTSLERLRSIKGIGQLSTKLQETFAKGTDYFSKMKSNNEELITRIGEIMVWLPEYQKSTRQIITSKTPCQAAVSKGLFRKEFCHKPVTWYDDEAEAVCYKCGIHLCEHHRIPVAMPPGSVIRNVWYCPNCARKLKK